ncbi:MAG: hypothetical protein GX347_03780 [Epulopiscium sp.]|nr:hypothetical protein [Candidatus Epulonipiscium sp.]
MEPSARKKQKRKFKKSNNRIYIGFFVFISLLFYLLGSIWTLAKKPIVPVEIANKGIIEKKCSTEGLIIRNEYVLPSPTSGIIKYFYTEGEKVSKNSLVGATQDEEFFNIIKQQLEQIEKNIQKIQEERRDITWFQKDIQQLNHKIITILSEQNQWLKEKGDFYAVYSVKDQIQHYIDQRNQLFILEPKGRLKDLVTEKMNYENQLQKNSHVISTPISGLVSFQIDGFENLTIDNIALEHFDNKIDSLQLDNETDQNISNIKIVEDTSWYIAALFPKETIQDWEVGKQISLFFPQKNYLEIPFIIDTIKQVEEKIIVIFRAHEYMHLFLNERLIDVEVSLEHYEGLKVSNSAIVEKSFLKIPRQCLIQSNKEQGVIRIIEDESIFLPITISYEDEQYVYIPTNNELRQYDIIIIQKGEQQEKYTIDQVDTSYGVYIANQGFAKFKKIKILGKNQDYTIIDDGTSYGVQMYDRIILDANQVKEGQFLHKSL